MPFTYERTIRLADTDAAGVVFFASTLALCHEAYEAGLASAGCEIADFLRRESDTLIPIAKASAEYLRPLFCGDLVRITLSPTRLSADSFAIDYEIVRLTKDARPKVAARARTEHVCTSRSERARVPLPEKLAAWIDGF